MDKKQFALLMLGAAQAQVSYWEEIAGAPTEKAAATKAPGKKATGKKATGKKAETKAPPKAEEFNMAEAPLSDVIAHLEKAYPEGTYSILPKSLSNIGILPPERQQVYLAMLGTANIKNFLKDFDVEAATKEGVNVAQIKMMMQPAGEQHSWEIDSDKNKAAIEKAAKKAGAALWKFMKMGDKFNKVGPDFMAIANQL